MKRPLSLAKPVRLPQAENNAQAELDASSGTARVVISASAHRALKVHCAQKGLQMKKVLDELLAAAGFK